MALIYLRIRFKSLTRSQHVYKNIWSPCNREKVAAGPKGREEELALYKKNTIIATSELAMHQQKFHVSCITPFEQVIATLPRLKHLENEKVKWT